MAGHVLGTACVIENLTSLLEKLYDDEAVDARLGLIAAVPNSYHRVASRSITRLSDWEQATRRKFDLRSSRPEIKHVPLKTPRSEDLEPTGSPEEPRITSHTAMRVRSVIDVHAWDQAVWKGACYGDYGPGYLCTEVAYSQGGYEPSASLVAPSVEGVLRKALQELLR